MGEMEKKSYSLLELNIFIKRILALNFESDVWVRAEILSMSVKKGHYYITLIQKDAHSNEIVAQINATIWSTDFLKIKKQNPEIESYFMSGHEMLLSGMLLFHERYGMQFRISNIDTAFTRGALDQKKEELFARINEEELNKINKQHSLPPAFRKIAVISSPTAAGYIDFINHLKQNIYQLKFGVQLFESTMQGQNLESEMIRNLEIISQTSNEFDALIIIRGGGSKVDLSGFDNYNLAKIIAHYPIPVFTGIGHEIDFSTIDLVAYRSFKTPTAVAEYFIETNINFLSEILDIQNKIKVSSLQKIVRYTNDLNTVILNINNKSSNIIQTTRHKLEIFYSKIYQSGITKIYNFKSELNIIMSQLNMLNPFEILKKGYVLIVQEDKTIRSKNDLKANQMTEFHFHDGTIITNINNIEDGKK